MSKTETAITPAPAKDLTPFEAQLTKLDNLANDCNIVAITANGGQFSSALALADKIAALREALTPEVMSRLMTLQGSQLGFRTDRDSKGNRYNESEVRDVFIEATFKGFKLTGNETNIISARFYGTKEGFEARMRDFAKAGAMTDLKITPGVPKTTTGGSEVRMQAAWKWRGVQDTLDVVIPVKTDQYSSADQVLGKARRKLLAQVYSRVTGTEVSEGEVGDIDTMRRTTPITQTDVGPAGTTTTAEPAVEKVDADTVAKLTKAFGDNLGDVVTYLREIGWLSKEGTLSDLTAEHGARVLKNATVVLEQAGVKPPKK